MTTSSSALSAYLFKLTQQVDYLYKRLELYHLALDELYHLPSYEQSRSLQSLLRNLHKHSMMLAKLQQKIRELTESDCSLKAMDRIDSLRYQLEELWEIQRTLTARTKKIRTPHDHVNMYLNAPAFLNV
ncbi:MAG TPA: hypothetical protein VI522_04040 [Gammaproteobacteria bacterium]|nr:hypothetical protein [Gammaproteobacteria bacterium]